MSNLFCVLIATSLLVANVDINRAIIDDDYGYRDGIDFASIEPTKSSIFSSQIIVKWSFSTKPTSSYSMKISVTNSQYPGGVNLVNQSYTSRANSLIYDYPQTYSQLNREDTFTIFLDAKRSHKISMKSKPYEPQLMQIKNENETFESAQNIAIYRRDEGIKYYTEKFVFTGYKKEMVFDRYRGVDFSNFTFKYIAPKSFPLSFVNPRLIIQSREGAFSNLGQAMTTPNAYKCGLNVIQNDDGNYQFKLLDQLYVHPTTLDMSTSPKVGYVATNYLYFPYPVEDYETYTFRFLVDDMGANNYDFSYEFNVILSSNLFGNCHDSEFCLNSEEAIPDLSLGTIISH